MRAITKGPEPSGLQAYRAVPGATYDGKDFTPVKDDIRAALLRDQLALCCYCMRRISSEERAHPTKPDAPPVVQMKVEHWKSQVAHISTLYCTSAGRLSSTNPQFQSDIDERLGLNHRVLVEDRKARLAREITRLIARNPRQSISLGALQQQIVELEGPMEGRLPEHACVLRLWARKRFGSWAP